MRQDAKIDDKSDNNIDFDYENSNQNVKSVYSMYKDDKHVNDYSFDIENDKQEDDQPLP